jgi:hypothetical protein
MADANVTPLRPTRPRDRTAAERQHHRRQHKRTPTMMPAPTVTAPPCHACAKLVTVGWLARR